MIAYCPFVEAALGARIASRLGKGHDHAAANAARELVASRANRARVGRNTSRFPLGR